MLDNAEIEFFSTIDIGGVLPIIYVDANMAQWDVSGMGFGYQCFQAIIPENPTNGRKVLVQGLKSIRGGNDWILLDEYPFDGTERSQEKIRKSLSKWGGQAGEAKVPSSPGYGPAWITESHQILPFKTWLEYVKEIDTPEETSTIEPDDFGTARASLEDFVLRYFGAEDLDDDIDTDKLAGFFGKSASLVKMGITNQSQIDSAKKQYQIGGKEFYKQKKLRDIVDDLYIGD